MSKPKTVSVRVDAAAARGLRKASQATSQLASAAIMASPSK